MHEMIGGSDNVSLIFTLGVFGFLFLVLLGTTLLLLTSKPRKAAIKPAILTVMMAGICALEWYAPTEKMRVLYIIAFAFIIWPITKRKKR